MTEFRNESPYPMVSIEEAQRCINALCAPLGVEKIASLYAAGRVLGESVSASEDVPDSPRSAMDGYAVRADDGVAERRVQGAITAGGDAAIVVTPGTAVRIMTGAPVPPGADAVIIVEQTEERDGVLRVHQSPRSGDNIHVVGQDIARGAEALAAGTVLGAPEIGLLATLGQTQARVYRRPRVAVLATGDEVVEPDAPHASGEVRDSNRYALLAAVREAGCDPISLGIVRDDVSLQRAAVLRGLAEADVLLTSGGVSMGSHDLIKPILAELGDVHFGRVAFKPGKPTTFATVNGKLVFGLPGYPVSSLVSFEVFVRPALRRLQGDTTPERPRVRVVLEEMIRPSRDRPEYQRVIVYWCEGWLVARSTGAQGSSRLLSLRGANGLLIAPPSEQPYPKGAELEAMLTGMIKPC